MKKIFGFFMTYFISNVMMAQSIEDGLRYSQTDISGTARFKALSGAFGALGGDLSAISVNPAGSSVFVNNQLALSLTNYGSGNTNDYLGKTSISKSNNLSLNQLGSVFVFSLNDAQSNWKKVAIALNYDKLNDFKNDLNFNGVNTNTLAKYFEYYANTANSGKPIPLELVTLQKDKGETVTGLYQYLGELPDKNYPNTNSFAAQQAMLGFQSYILEPNLDSNNKIVNYGTNVTTGTYMQTNALLTKGYNGKFTINLSGQYGEKLYLGMSLNPHFFEYTQSLTFNETNKNKIFSTGVTVDQILFSNNLRTYGNGFSLQLGLIYKVSKLFRLGFAYESPTWLNVNEELTQSVRTSGFGINPTYSNVTVAPNFTNVYQPYTLTTPSKTTLSGAYVFNKRGLLSIDYSYKNYSNVAFAPENDFKNLNTAITNQLTNTSELRVGGEFKAKQWSFRAGYRFEESPYIDKLKMSDLKGYSCGIGYNFGGIKLDFALAKTKQSYSYQVFNRGLLDTAVIQRNNKTIALSMLFEL